MTERKKRQAKGERERGHEKEIRVENGGRARGREEKRMNE